MEKSNYATYPGEPPQFKELVAYIWGNKVVVFITVALFLLISIGIALTAPNTYKATALVVPTQNLQGKDALLDSQFGGIAALAGISLNNDGAFKTEVAIAKIHSKEFMFRFLTKYELVPKLIALKKWQQDTNVLHYDSDIYDENARLFLLEQDKSPLWLAYKAFLSSVAVEKEKNGLITLSFKHESPFVAKSVVEQLLLDINRESKVADIEQADRSISYLTEQLNKTELSDMRVMFFRLIEEQIKAKMLTEIKDEYIFTTIDPAIVPEEIHSPQRALIIVVSVLLGGMLGVFLVLLRFYASR